MLKIFLSLVQDQPALLLRRPAVRLAEPGPRLVGGVLCVCSGEVGMALDCLGQGCQLSAPICGTASLLPWLAHPML